MLSLENLQINSLFSPINRLLYLHLSFFSSRLSISSFFDFSPVRKTVAFPWSIFILCCPFLCCRWEPFHPYVECKFWVSCSHSFGKTFHCTYDARCSMLFSTSSTSFSNAIPFKCKAFGVLFIVNLKNKQRNFHFLTQLAFQLNLNRTIIILTYPTPKHTHFRVK